MDLAIEITKYSVGTAADTEHAEAQAEHIKAVCFEFAKTWLEPPVQFEDEMMKFLAPIAEVAEKKDISLCTIEILFDIMLRLAMIQQRIERPMLETCMKMNILPLVCYTSSAVLKVHKGSACVTCGRHGACG